MGEASTNGVSPDLARFAERVVFDADILCEETASRLLHALSKVDRSKFVEQAYRDNAYGEESVPIGCGRTLLKPSVFALMVSLLGLRRGMRVLEIGSGSGYGSAVLSAAGLSTFAIESDGLLAQRARRTLDALHFHGVIFSRSDLSRGWAEHAPFDGIVYSVPVDKVEDDILRQLKSPGGRLVAPVRGVGLCMWEAREDEIVSYPMEVGETFDE